MRKIVEGKIFDTENAKLVHSWSIRCKSDIYYKYQLERNDRDFFELYFTNSGNFILVSYNGVSRTEIKKKRTVVEVKYDRNNAKRIVAKHIDKDYAKELLVERNAPEDVLFNYFILEKW